MRWLSLVQVSPEEMIEVEAAGSLDRAGLGKPSRRFRELVRKLRAASRRPCGGGGSIKGERDAGRDSIPGTLFVGVAVQDVFEDDTGVAETLSVDIRRGSEKTPCASAGYVRN